MSVFSRRCWLIFSFGSGCQRAGGLQMLLILQPPPWALHRARWALHRARWALTIRPQQHLLRLLRRRLLRLLLRLLRRLLLLRLREQRWRRLRRLRLRRL